MGWYQQYLGDSDTPSKVYHLCPKSQWENRPKKYEYAPPSYDTEKFVRTSHDVNRLVETANCFYQKSSPPTEAWICLEIDTMGLGMNQIETKMVPSETVPDLKCPHVYGKIPEETVRNIYQVQRDASTGEFSIITGLTDTCALHPSNK